MAAAADMKESNRSEAERAMELAEDKFRSGLVVGARRLAGRAQRMCPDLPGLHQAIVAYDVHIAAQAGDEDGGGGLLRWRKVLDVGPSSDIQEVRSQVKRLRLLVHPDKNPSAAANGAFHLVNEAWQAMSGHLQSASTSGTAINRGGGDSGSGSGTTSSSGCRSSRASGSPSTVGRSKSSRVAEDGGVEGEDTIKDRIFSSRLSRAGGDLRFGASARNSSPAKGDQHHHEAQPYSSATNSPPDHYTTPPLHQQRSSSTPFAANKAQMDDFRSRNAQANSTANCSKSQPSTSTINPGVSEDDGQGNINRSSRQVTNEFSPNNVILGRASSSSFSRRQSDLPRNGSENDLRRLFTTTNTSNAWFGKAQAGNRSSRQVRHNHNPNAGDVPRDNYIHRQGSSSISFTRRECDPVDGNQREVLQGTSTFTTSKTGSNVWLCRRGGSKQDQQPQTKPQTQTQLDVDPKMKKGCFNHKKSRHCIIM